VDANVIANHIAQLVTIGLVVYVGLHLSSRIQTLQATVDAQKTTIDAQAEQLKAQSTVLQDFERFNRTMKLAVDTFADPAAIERERAYRARVDRDTTALLVEQEKQLREQGIQAIAQVRQAYEALLSSCTRLIGYMLPLLYPGLRRTFIDARKLSSTIKEVLQHSEPRWASSTPIIINQTWLDQLRASPVDESFFTLQPDTEREP
jgi:hypothetical protein